MNTIDTGAARRYFDWAATALPDSAEIRAGDSTSPIAPFGNPSSPYSEGRAAREALENARSRCAAVLGVAPETLYFTSGGTEANCIAILSGLFRSGGSKGSPAGPGRAVCSAAEHPSVRENLGILEKFGKSGGRIPADSLGAVTPELLAKTLDKYGDVRFAAIMAVNNETGAVSSVAELRDVMRKRSGAPVHFHCDMVQALGKIPLDLSRWDVDSASFSAHKIGGPRGIGLLYLRRPAETLCRGGGQERGIRPGTENTAGALALAACMENHAAPEKLTAAGVSARQRWRRLCAGLQRIERCVFIPQDRGIDDERFSPYILQTAFKDIPGEVMVRALDDMGFAVATGSACSSSSPDRPVLAAMGIDEQLRLEGIRISQGWSTTDEDIDALLEAVAEVLRFL